MIRTLRLTLIAALLCATGAQWVLLQTFAWTKMSWERVGAQGVVSAVVSATDGRHLCRLCLAARTGAADAQKRLPARGSHLRLDFVSTTAVGVASVVVASWDVSPVRVAPSELTAPVELPPPCRLPA